MGAALFSLYFVYYSFAVQKRHTRPKIVRSKKSFELADPKYVLYYTTFQNHSFNWVTGTKKRMFPRKGCDVLNCVFTSNRSLLASVSDFDAIIFRIRRSNFVDDNGQLEKSVFLALHSSEFILLQAGSSCLIPRRGGLRRGTSRTGTSPYPERKRVESCRRR